MSVTGSGTSADPYVVETYDELKTTIENNSGDLYVKFADNVKIDLTQVYSGAESPYIITKVDRNLSIDGNGAVITGYSNSENGMFWGGNGATSDKWFELKNITIDSMYTPNSGLLEPKILPRFDHVKIAGVTGGKEALVLARGYYNYAEGWIRQSSFTISKNRYDTVDNGGRLVIFADATRSNSWPSDLGGSGYSTAAGLFITDCVIDITSIVKICIIAGGGGSWQSKKTIFSRNTVKINKGTPVHRIWDSNDNNEIDISNTVIRGNSEETITLYSIGSNFTGVAIVDGTNLPNAVLEGSPNPFKILTVEEMKNPAYLRSIGFECV
jgi:hypothetical protein